MRDSKRYRFAIPNKIWDHKLRPIMFMIFSYLCYCHSNHSAAMISPDDVARGTHVTVSTAKKYLSVLVNSGLVSDDWSLTSNLQCDRSKKFFSLPNEIFLLKLTPSAFMVYAYLLLIEDRKTHTCHPSYNTISTATGMSKNTALKSIGVLLEAGLIAVEPRSYFDKRGMKWKGNNLYTIFGDEENVDLNAAMQELNEYPGNIWTHIISLKREDAERCTYRLVTSGGTLLSTMKVTIPMST